MDRRQSFAWMLLMLSLFMLWSSWSQQRELQKIKAEQELVQREKKKTEEAKKVREKAAEAIEKLEVEPPSTFPASWHTLGSMDAKDGFPLLVTLTSKGAGIERIELVEQRKPERFRYRSLAARGGYLGYLAAIPEEGKGLRVHSVPRGSAAAKATGVTEKALVGIEPGDLLDKVDGEEVRTVDGLEALLVKRKPGAQVELSVWRGDSPEDARELTFQATLTEAPADVVRMEDDFPREKVPGNLPRPSMWTTFSKIDGIELVPGNETIPGLEATLEADWEAKPFDVPDGMGIEFRLPLKSYLAGAGIKADLDLIKRYRLFRAKRGDGVPASVDSVGYHVDVETTVRNAGGESHSIALRQEGLNGISLEAWWYAIKLSPDFFNAAGARDVMLARKAGPHELMTRRSIQEYARSHPDQPDSVFFGMDYPTEKRSFRYLGVDQQYFTTAILPHPESPDALDDLAQGAARAIADIPRTVPYKDIATNVGFWFDTKVMKVEPASELSKKYRVYAGPKDPDALDVYGLSGAIYFGWSIFEWVAKPLSFILHTFYSLVRNYGIAIMMLTVLVRSCMFPLSRRAAIMGQRMQEMAPEMKRINELYKDDVTKRGQEMQALYKKYNLNPMASCLPVFIQLPIFIGLYRCVSVDIELRQQPLIPGLDWCSNLAGPDMLASWPSWMPDFIAGKGTGWFGPYINLLPIITIALFIVQQKVLMPKATDEQTRMTQQMMMFMTVFMGVLFFKVPAGLCIYFITSSLWSLVERRLIKKFIPAMPEVSANGGMAVSAPPPPPPPAQPVRPKAMTKSPETIGEAVDQLKSFFGKGKKPEATKSSSDIAQRRKQYRKNKDSSR